MATNYSSRADILKDISSGVLKTGDIFKRGNKEFIVKEGGKYQGYKGGADYQARALLMREGFNGQTEATQADQAYATGGITAVQEGIDAGTISSSSANTYSSGASNVTSDSGSNYSQYNTGSSNSYSSSTGSSSTYGQETSAQDAMSGNIENIGRMPQQGDFVDPETGEMNWQAYAQAQTAYANKWRNAGASNLDIATKTNEEDVASFSPSVPVESTIRSQLLEGGVQDEISEQVQSEKESAMSIIDRRIKFQEEQRDASLKRKQNITERTRRGFGGVDERGAMTNMEIGESFAIGAEEDIQQWLDSENESIEQSYDRLEAIEAEYGGEVSKRFEEMVDEKYNQALAVYKMEYDQYRDSIQDQRNALSDKLSIEASERAERKFQLEISNDLYDKQIQQMFDIPAKQMSLIEKMKDTVGVAGTQAMVGSMLLAQGMKKSEVNKVLASLKTAESEADYENILKEMDKFEEMDAPTRKALINYMQGEKKINMQILHEELTKQEIEEAKGGSGGTQKTMFKATSTMYNNLIGATYPLASSLKGNNDLQSADWKLATEWISAKKRYDAIAIQWSKFIESTGVDPEDIAIRNPDLYSDFTQAKTMWDNMQNKANSMASSQSISSGIMSSGFAPFSGASSFKFLGQ